MRTLLRAILVLTLLAGAGCRKPAGTDWNVDVVMPIANSKLSITNFVSDSLLAADSSGLLHFRFNREVASFMLDSLLQLPDTTLIDTLPGKQNVPITLTLTPGDNFNFFQPSEIEFDIGGGIEITFADIRTAQLSVRFSNLVSEPLDIVYRIPSATKYGQTFEIRETVPPGENSLSRTYDLSGYRLNMRGEKGNKFNTIVQTYTVGLNENANSVIVKPGEGVIIELRYSNIVPDYIEGFFGNETEIIDPDTATFGFLDNFSAENFMLSEATMKFRILNEIGADFRASLSNINSINSATGKSVPLITDKLDRLNINMAERIAGGARAKPDSVVFNSANSNITAFISNLPDQISYQGEVTVNPLPPGKDVAHTNFAYYNTGIRINADVDIPVKFTANKFRLQSSAEIDLENNDQLDNVRGGNFHISVVNGFPFDAVLQVYMQNGNGTIIDSLFLPGSNLMRRATLNAQNIVVSPVPSELLIPATPAKAANLRKCKTLLIRPVFIMPPNPPDISILESYSFEVKIRAELLYNVGIN